MKWAEQAQRLLRKAAADHKAMSVLLASPEVEEDVIGFHAQQAAEKYLKALLSHRRIPFSRTHDLRTLLDLLQANGLEAPGAVEEICQLFPYAVDFRYEDPPSSPGSSLGRDWMAARVKAVEKWVVGHINPGGRPA